MLTSSFETVNSCERSVVGRKSCAVVGSICCSELI
ncbi:unnamed protein product [Brugia timori]|uniref:Uncharacterized protein n=1 Tax=Brugia timori TaxID=42155 RepID=A0A3P7W0H1_9BILA|nr:unnamed protein product [Brugia timori]